MSLASSRIFGSIRMEYGRLAQWVFTIGLCPPNSDSPHSQSTHAIILTEENSQKEEQRSITFPLQ